MHNPTKHQIIPNRMLNLFAIAFVMLPVIASGQVVLPADSASSIAGIQFATIEKTLSNRADAALSAMDEPPTGRPQSLDVSNYNSDIFSGQSVRPAFIGKVNSAMDRVGKLTPLIDPILREEGVPAELAGVVLVESGGRPFALSPKGARGLWQLMPATARRYGLAVDAVRDERLDIGKSTRAAARYLSDLHLQFGSWPLALAAYNTGEQHVQRAINRTGSSQLALLNASGLLPLETRNYVPAVLAATRLFDRQLFVTATVPAAPTNRVFATSTQ